MSSNNSRDDVDAGDDDDNVATIHTLSEGHSKQRSHSIDSEVIIDLRGRHVRVFVKGQRTIDPEVFPTTLRVEVAHVSQGLQHHQAFVTSDLEIYDESSALYSHRNDT